MHVESHHIDLQILGRMFGKKSNAPTENTTSNRKPIEFEIAKIAVPYMHEEENFESIVRFCRSDLRRSEIENKVLYDAFQSIQEQKAKLLDVGRRCRQDEIFDEIRSKVQDPEKVNQIRVGVLRAAIGWWNEKLNDPDMGFGS